MDLVEETAVTDSVEVAVEEVEEIRKKLDSQSIKVEKPKVDLAEESATVEEVEEITEVEERVDTAAAEQK